MERVLLPRLAPMLPVPIPAPTIFGEPSADFPFRFQGHRRLDGVAASRWRSSLPADARHAGTITYELATGLRTGSGRAVRTVVDA